MTSKDININVDLDIVSILQKNESDQKANRTKNEEDRLIKKQVKKIVIKSTPSKDFKEGEENEEEEALYSRRVNIGKGFLKDEPPAYEDKYGLKVGTLWLYSFFRYPYSTLLGFGGAFREPCFSYQLFGSASFTRDIITDRVYKTIISGDGLTAIDREPASNPFDYIEPYDSVVKQGATHYHWEKSINNPPVYSILGTWVYTEMHRRRTSSFPVDDIKGIDFALPIGGGDFIFITAHKTIWYALWDEGYYVTTQCYDYPGVDSASVPRADEYSCYPGTPGTIVCAPDILSALRSTWFQQVLSENGQEVLVEPWFEISNSGFLDGGIRSSYDRTIEVYVGNTNKLRKIYDSYEDLPEPIRQVMDACFPEPYMETRSISNPYRSSTDNSTIFYITDLVPNINQPGGIQWQYNQDDGWFFNSFYQGIVFTPQIFQYINDNFYNFTDSAKSWDDVKDSTRMAMANLSPSSAYRDNELDDLSDSQSSFSFFYSELSFKHDLWPVPGQVPSTVLTRAQIYNAYETGVWEVPTNPPTPISPPINKSGNNYSMGPVSNRYQIILDPDPDSAALEFLDRITVWDWNDPDYCRQKCLELGFTENDLKPDIDESP